MNVGGTLAGTSDPAGQVDVDVQPGSAIEVGATDLVSHTLLGVSSRRFGVVLPAATTRTRTVTGTLSGINDLRLPPDGYRRVVEIRAGNTLTPLSLRDGLAIGAPADCTLAGDECSFTIEVDERVSHVNATIVDTTDAFADRLVAAFAISGTITEGSVSFAVPGREGGTQPVVLESGLDVVVGVPGARVGDDIMLFGSPTSTSDVPVPTLGEGSWLAVIYGGTSDELHAGIVQSPGSTTSAPSAPSVSIDGTSLSLPSGRLTTISLARGSTELWRATVLDGRGALSVPGTDADTVCVVVHGPSTGASEPGALEDVEAVVALPIVR